jgi:hypothetical protein
MFSGRTFRTHLWIRQTSLRIEILSSGEANNPYRIDRPSWTTVESNLNNYLPIKQTGHKTHWRRNENLSLPTKSQNTKLSMGRNEVRLLKSIESYAFLQALCLHRTLAGLQPWNRSTITLFIPKQWFSQTSWAPNYIRPRLLPSFNNSTYGFLQHDSESSSCRPSNKMPAVLGHICWKPLNLGT